MADINLIDNTQLLFEFYSIYKNDPDRIKWTKPVHEQLVGYDKFASLPGNPEYCLYHPKDIKRQEKQNNFYETL